MSAQPPPDASRPRSRRERRAQLEQETATQNLSSLTSDRRVLIQPSARPILPTTGHSPEALPDSLPAQPSPAPSQTPIPTPPYHASAPHPSPPLPSASPRPAPPGPSNLIRSHAIGALAGLALTPPAILALALGSSSLVDAPIGRTDPDRVGASAGTLLAMGILELLVGAALIGVLAVISGRRSALALTVGAIWPLGLSVVAGPLYRWAGADTLLLTADSGLWDKVVHALAATTTTGLFSTVTIVMMVGAAGAGPAYDAGRAALRWEREHLTEVADHLRRHSLVVLGLAMAGVALTLGGILALIPLHNRVSVAASGVGGSDLPFLIQVGLPIVGIMLFFVMALTTARSSVAMAAGGIVVALLPGLVLAVGMVLSSDVTMDWLTWLTLATETSMSISGGPLVGLGLVMVACSLAALAARRAGRADESHALERVS